MSAELDRQVAEAIGFRRKIQVGPMSRAVGLYSRDRGAEIVEVGADDPRMPQEVIPKYSTDLNAAFEAAEKVGDYIRLARGNGSSFSRGLYRASLAPMGQIHTGETPALAICNAIIGLHSEQGD